ncbi:MAG: TIR domain-containing protein [Candidatus Aenigmarchaeota archaeon]|nr:TIR domain-containing protein [Candidatus Aenigmarchaeota archaeon]
MARKVFFSFHYEKDAWRAGQVRNSNVVRSEDTTGFIDASEWEKVKERGQDAIKNWINEQLKGTSITVVLIGSETSERDWVKYELQRSYEKGNAFLGIFIHNLEDQEKRTTSKGDTRFGELGKDSEGKSVYLFQLAKFYDWKNDDGYNNFTKWIEEAISNQNGN